MKQHYVRKENYISSKARIYFCSHPLYKSCTLYFYNNKGLAVIQQRFNSKLKISWWGPIDQWLVDDIFNQEGFKSYFDSKADKESDGIFPTVSVRQIMWALRMKPLKSYFWESKLTKLD